MQLLQGAKWLHVNNENDDEILNTRRIFTGLDNATHFVDFLIQSQYVVDNRLYTANCGVIQKKGADSTGVE